MSRIEPGPLLDQCANRDNQILAAVASMYSVGFDVMKYDVPRNMWGPHCNFLSRSSCIVAGVDEER
jgi:hypothetical protein